MLNSTMDRRTGISADPALQPPPPAIKRWYRSGAQLIAPATFRRKYEH